MEKETIKQLTIGFAVLVVTLLIAASLTGFSVTGKGTTDSLKENAVAAAPGGSVQNVKLSLENFAYKVEPSTLTLGVPVRMEVDLNTVTGCTRTVTIPAFGVQKTVSAGNNIIEFTPTKAGTIHMQCSMGMARGTFTVLEADGSTSNYVDAAPAGGGSCGSGAGGCGCGG